MPRPQKVVYTHPPDASFIQKFKERSGFVHPTTVEDKLRSQDDEGVWRVRSDEQPQIVLLNDKANISLEEAEKFVQNELDPTPKETEETASPKFRLPENKNRERNTARTNNVMNAQLLSFEDDNDDD